MVTRAGARRSHGEGNLPKNHSLILDLIRESGRGQHLTAYDVLILARKRQPSIGLATVHRAVAQLHELGLIAKVEIPGQDGATYEPTAKPHAHFRCKRCGRVEDVEYALARRTLRDLAARNGFRIEGEQISFTGCCRNCLKDERKLGRTKAT